MAKLLYQLEGVRGRSIQIYDRKCVISTKAGVGSFLTGNVSDGEKTIFYTDVVGIQFKKSGGLIGYLQFETGSVQMNNQNSNMFSENTFTFEHNKNGNTNEKMEAIYHQLCDILESIKYGSMPQVSADEIPALQAPAASAPAYQAPVVTPPAPKANTCPKCGRPFAQGDRFCMACGQRLG